MALPVAMQDKLSQAEELYAKAERILLDTEATTEEKATVQQMIDDAEALTTEALQLDMVQTSFTKLREIADANEGPTGSNYKKFGQFLGDVWAAGKTMRPNARLIYLDDERPTGATESKDLAEAIGSTGGFLVPAEFQTDVFGVLGEPSVFMQRATHIPMRRRQMSIPVLDQTDTSAGVPHWFGGIQAYWVAEAAEKPQSDPSWREITLTAHEMVGYTRASNALLDDSAVSLEAFFNGPLGFNGAMTHLMDWATINGTGAGMPLGWLNAGATIVVDRATSGTIGYPDLLNMLQAFLMTGGQGMWMASQSTLATLAQMSGPASHPAYVWLNDAKQGIPGTRLGMPIVFTEKLPLLGQQGDIALINPPFYLVGDRQAVTIESTQYDRWRHNQTSWRAVARMDGQPWLSAPLTLMDGVSTLSPFVILGDTST